VRGQEGGGRREKKGKKEKREKEKKEKQREGERERERETGKQLLRERRTLDARVDGVARFIYDAPSLLNYVAPDVYFRCLDCALGAAIRCWQARLYESSRLERLLRPRSRRVIVITNRR